MAFDGCSQLEGSHGLDGCSGFIVSRHVTSLSKDQLAEGEGRANQEEKVPSKPNRHGRSRYGLAHRYGTTLSDLYTHSWRRTPEASWRWIPKILALGEVGYLARRGEVRRLGSTARIVRRVRDPEPL